MFENIGGKIKTLAKVITFLGIGLSVAFGFLLIVGKDYMAGLVTIIVGVLVSWIGSFVLYSWGEVIDELKEQTKIQEGISVMLTNQINNQEKKETESHKAKTIEENTKRYENQASTVKSLDAFIKETETDENK